MVVWAAFCGRSLIGRYGRACTQSAAPVVAGGVRADERHPPLRRQRVRFLVTPVVVDTAARGVGDAAPYGGVRMFSVTPVGRAGFMAAEVSGHYGAVHTFSVTPVEWAWGLFAVSENPPFLVIYV